MSHLEFIKKIRNTKTDNRFFLSRYNAETKEFDSTNVEYQYCVIGRNPDCCVRVSAERCSRYHCALYFTDATLNVQDLDSKIGSYRGTWRDNQLTSKQQLPPFTQQHVSEGDCVQVDDQIFRVDRIVLARMDTEPIQIVPAVCRFCGNKVHTYLRELQRLGDQTQLLDTQAQHTAAALAAEEQRLADVLARIEQIAQNKAEQKVSFKSKVSLIGSQEATKGDSSKVTEAPQSQKSPQKPLKSTRERKNTPFARAAYDDDE